MNLICPKDKTHEFNYTGSCYRALCPACRKKGIVTWVKTGIKVPQRRKLASHPASHPASHHASRSLDVDLMKGNVVDSFKRMGLDPMGKGQLRDSISILLETYEYKTAWAKAVTDKKIGSVKLARKVLRDWLKREKYI